LTPLNARSLQEFSDFLSIGGMSIVRTMDQDSTAIFRQFPAAAEYLSAIFILKRDYGSVGNSQVAAWLFVTSPAVTQALGRLKRFGLVKQERYGTIALTDACAALAVSVLRRHYLLEHLLVGQLNYPWEKADEEAKRLQGTISEELTEHMYLRFGSPQACPHGNPLPGSSVEAKLLAAPRLSSAPVGAVIRILRITEEGERVPHMLEICHERGVRPGALFKVVANDDSSLRLLPAGPLPPSGAAREVTIERARAAHVRFEEYS
jgi:DtxR family Mn-dependent transcriptional regulator